MEQTEDPRLTAKQADRVAESAEAREFLERYVRLIQRNPSTPSDVRARVGVLLRRVADPEPPILRVAPEVAAAVVAIVVAAALVVLEWIQPVPMHLFIAVCAAFLIAYPGLLRVHRRRVRRRRSDAIRELEVLLPS